MKKLLLLGGLRYLIPVINIAQEMGLYVITCDNVPGNIAHKYSNEYQNVSIIDKDEVLKLAKELDVDGIMSFAVDPGVVTAAYVAEKLNLPKPGPYESVKILQDKALFRDFLEKNNFNVPKAKGYIHLDEAIVDIEKFSWPVIVKPVDSAGSKGVGKVENYSELREKIQNAISHSQSKQFIIEEYIEQKGFASDSESFSINGELTFFTLSNQYFDKNSANPYTPAGFTWPSNMADRHKKNLSSEIQRLLKLLKMRTSIYNIEARVGKDDKPYIMEVSPRGGGNRLAEMIKYITNVDLIENSVKAAIGEKVDFMQLPSVNEYWGEIILHSNKEGIFRKIEISPNLEKYVIEVDVWVKNGEYIKQFLGANETIGTIVIRTDNKNTVEKFVSNIWKYIDIIVD
ncbi:ATP-grasp domain-containing protein [Draconibacterium halophilum]|uniref:ATP-grasp domain-containing protein n=1 Tax=Draconibacterium halophilum TaxID=2706887 RepID=A0A6C0RDV4_9BACT|nr:ATP-grasp domain-containing protein [Draconibacterium halophilum]QIA08520.1 ATP-grasp domain-containing protein [Draconibacterium halophilum]